MLKPKSPCYHCNARKAACQTICTLYAVFVEQNQIYKGLVDSARQHERNIDKFKYERVVWTKRQCER